MLAITRTETIVVANHGTPPAETVSQYVHLYDQAQLENLGCSEATSYPGGTVILAFGEPNYNGSFYGVWGYDNQFHSTGAIAGLVESFARGYFNCSSAQTNVRIGMGTNNGGLWHDRNAGRDWGSWIQEVNRWLADVNAHPPYDYSTRIFVWGADDIELAYGSAFAAREFLAGYAETQTRPLLDYGDCQDCPHDAAPGSTPCCGWTINDVWWKAYGADRAFPFPEIYFPYMADQWQRMSLYSYLNHPGYSPRYMDFQGTLSQYRACQQVPDATCPGTLTSYQAWQALYDELQADSRTAMIPYFRSDIRQDP